jgi:enterobactin synthetase component D
LAKAVPGTSRSTAAFLVDSEGASLQFQPITELNCLLLQPFSALRFSVPELVTPQDFAAFGITFPDNLRSAVPKRRAEYLAGRKCAQQALQQFGIKNVQVGTGENRAPVWPSGVLGTITHSNNLALAMVTRIGTCRGIGADIENFMSQQQELELKDSMIYPGEQQQFALLSRQIVCPLTLVFSAKESIFKALYPSVNQYFGFEAAALTGFNENCLWFTITTALSDRVPAGSNLTVWYQLFDGWLLTECQF